MTGSEHKTVWLHLLGLAIFSSALYLPILGRGFIHDDFLWLNDAVYRPLGYEMSHPVGGPFYSPLGLLTFRAGWSVWGFHAFPYGVENLMLHIANTFLLYGMVFLLWRSAVAAWWAAFGFALLFPANIWAVMWIATRSHLLATLFYLAALCATIWYVRSDRQRLLAGMVTVALTAAAMLSKESGVTLALAIPVMVWYEQRRRDEPVPWHAVAFLMAALLAVVVVYLILRTRSGAVPIFSSNHSWYQYSLSASVLVENLLRYSWRTYGLQTLLGGTLAISLWIRGIRPHLAGVTRYDLLLSGLLFLTPLAPVVLLRGRSGIYSYLPGIGASVVLGAVVQSLYAGRPQGPHRRLSVIPVLALTAIYAVFTVGQSAKWKHMAETNDAVLGQIRAQFPQPAARTFVILRYAEPSEKQRLLDGFASWGFPPALQLLYADPTLTGAIIGQGESPPSMGELPPVQFRYREGFAGPEVVKETPGVARE
jgi:hypothetical protein